MQAAVMSFWDGQACYITEEACAGRIAKLRWPEGFRCPHGGQEQGWYTGTRRHYECACCYRQTSITGGTLFHGSRLPLRKWFWAVYWASTDKGSISALRLSRLIDVQRRSAHTLLRRLPIAMRHRDSLYRLTELIEVDDAHIGAHKTGKAGRGGGRTPVLVAVVKTDEGKPGYAAIEVLESLAKPFLL